MKVPTVLFALSGAALTMAHSPALREARDWVTPNINVTATKNTEGSLQNMLNGSLHNCLSRNRAQKCDGLAEDVFIERTLKFLSFWKTEDYPHDSNDQTEKDLLLRLVEYQDVYQTLVTENDDHQRFPDNIVDLVRSARDRATEKGVLLSSNARVLDALDVIYNDICGTTKESKVPRRVQEITDIVLRGLDRNYENTPFVSKSEPCVCSGYYRCGIISTTYWDISIKDWQCDCNFVEDCSEEDGMPWYNSPESHNLARR
ncbi:hypothetical protein PG991_008881 [Apiospora marii]|uniref:Uncharacterized protein n=1 Tax=Apiospora marii TaxID=335849 RepID=A0ABR1RP14_9PEZI